MALVSIYFYKKNKIFITYNNKSDTGLTISSDEFLCFDFELEHLNLFKNINLFLNKPTLIIPHPKDWKIFTEKINTKLKELGVSSISKLEKNSSYCQVELKNKKFYIQFYEFDSVNKAFLYTHEKELIDGNENTIMTNLREALGVSPH